MRICFSITILTCGLIGCERAPEAAKLVPVSGKIQYAGKSAAGIRVTFYPTSEPALTETGRPVYPTGTVDANGQFTLQTSGHGNGAAPGSYQVVLNWPTEVAEDQEAKDEDRLLGWYDVAHSSLTVKVIANELTLPTINLPPVKGPPEAVQGIPGRN